MNGEQWRPVVGYETTYQVSDQGRVWSALSNRLLRPVLNQGRYKVKLYASGKPQTKLVHRLMAAAFLGPCPEGQEVCHGDGNPQNNTLSNIRYGTRSENNQDTLLHGTHHNASKTHCVNDHEYTTINTRNTPYGRVCRTCDRERKRVAA